MKLLDHFKELTVHPKNAEELKGLILQSAVQGKLTKKWREENPDVEPASVAYERIIGEKADLIKSRIIKNEASLPRISEDENIAGIPNTWLSCRLGEVGDWGAGATPSRSRTDFYGGDVNWFKSGELNDGIIDYDSKEKINELAIKNSSLRLNKIGDVLIAMYGATIGKTAILAVEGATNQAVCACTPFSCISNVYLHLLLKALKNVFIDQGEGGAQPNISRVKIRTQIFALPPLEEQKAIVSIVNQLFAEVEELEQQTKARIQLKEDFVTSALQRLANGDTATEWTFLQEHFNTFFTEKSAVKKLRESILQLAVQGKLTSSFRASNPELVSGAHAAQVLLEKLKAEKEQLIKAKKIKKEKPLPEITEEEIPFELPEGWVWCRLQDLEYILGDGIHGTPRYTINGDYHFINGNNLNDGVIEIKSNTKTVSKEEYLIHQRKLNDRTVLVSINGTIGNTAFYNGENVMLGKSACYFNLFDGIDKEYVRQLIKSNYFREYAFSSATGTTIKNVSLHSMRSFNVPLPPLEEQKTIVAKVSALMALCDRLEEEIEQNTQQLEQLMQSCLKEVFEGEEIEEEILGMAAGPAARYGN